MKTPIQKAIDKVIFVRNMCNDENNEMFIKHVLDTLKEDLNKLLEEEKEHIVEAYLEGADYNNSDYVSLAKEYYNTKYQNKNNSLPELLDKDGIKMRKVNLCKEAQDILDIAINELNQNK